MRLPDIFLGCTRVPGRGQTVRNQSMGEAPSDTSPQARAQLRGGDSCLALLADDQRERKLKSLGVDRLKEHRIPVKV